MIDYPWTSEEDNRSDMDKSYFFDTTYPEFKYLFIDFYDNSKNKVAGLVLSRMKTNYEPFTKIKILDLFHSDAEIDYLSLIKSTAEIIHELNVDFVEIPDDWIQKSNLTLDQIKRIENSRPPRIVNGYFKEKNSSLDPSKATLTRTSSDGDLAFA
jgi:hypothetical protein